MVSSVTVLFSVDIQDLLVVCQLDRLTQLTVHVLWAVCVMGLSLWVDWLEQILMNFWLLSTKGGTQLRVMMLLARLQMVVVHLHIMNLILVLNVMYADLLMLVVFSTSLHHNRFRFFFFLSGSVTIDKIVEEASYTSLRLVIFHFVCGLSSWLLSLNVAAVLLHGGLRSIVVSGVSIEILLWSIWLSSLHTSDTSVMESFDSFSLRLLL